MKECTFNCLSQKEVISCLDCTRLGFISDLNIDLESARIISIIIEEQNGFFSLFKRNYVTIPWECISKIGEDLIIVDYLKPPSLPRPEKRESKFGFHLKN